jgi:hypothetical protein
MTHEYTPGRGYVPMSIWDDAKQSHAPMAAAPSSIVNNPKSPLESHLATGEATLGGERRTDVGESVTAHVQKLFRYFNTLDHREIAAQYGGAHRLSTDDVLMRQDRRTEAGFKLPAGRVDEALKETLGILENKTGLPAPEQEGLSAGIGAALSDMAGHLFPRLGSDEELRRIDATAPRGEAAPPGYVWVPKQMARLKDLEAAVSPRDATSALGRLGRFADNMNGSITGATVYYKVGHLFTRVFTNGATNIMQGSANPFEIAKSVETHNDLTPEEQQQGLAYAGISYHEAAPGAEGATLASRGMQKGLHIPFTDRALRTKGGVAVMSPQWWSHIIDAPFRFNSIAYEVRKAGYGDGADGFRQFLHEVEGYNQLDASARARVDGVLRRSDREAIAYDRLNVNERQIISRAIWFYPWIKGSTVFTANTLFEHPFKAAVLGNLGNQGEQKSRGVLGDMPSYANGLTPLSGGTDPLVSDFNTFNPFSTAADLMQIPSHKQNLAGMANPIYGFGLNTAEGVNQYGAADPHAVMDNVKSLFGSVPEWQVANAAQNGGGDQSHKLYPAGHGLDPLWKNWLGELVRSFASPAMARHVNPLAGHSLAQRERTGR